MSLGLSITSLRNSRPYSWMFNAWRGVRVISFVVWLPQLQYTGTLLWPQECTWQKRVLWLHLDYWYCVFICTKDVCAASFWKQFLLVFRSTSIVQCWGYYLVHVALSSRLFYPFLLDIASAHFALLVHFFDLKDFFTKRTRYLSRKCGHALQTVVPRQETRPILLYPRLKKPSSSKVLYSGLSARYSKSLAQGAQPVHWCVIWYPTCAAQQLFERRLGTWSLPELICRWKVLLRSLYIHALFWGKEGPTVCAKTASIYEVTVFYTIYSMVVGAVFISASFAHVQ